MVKVTFRTATFVHPGLKGRLLRPRVGSIRCRNCSVETVLPLDCQVVIMALPGRTIATDANNLLVIHDCQANTS